MASVDFNNLLVNNADFLKPFAINLTKDTETAKDLFQETLYYLLLTLSPNGLQGPCQRGKV